MTNATTRSFPLFLLLLFVVLFGQQVIGKDANKVVSKTLVAEIGEAEGRGQRQRPRLLRKTPPYDHNDDEGGVGGDDASSPSTTSELKRKRKLWFGADNNQEQLDPAQQPILKTNGGDEDVDKDVTFITKALQQISNDYMRDQFFNKANDPFLIQSEPSHHNFTDSMKLLQHVPWLGDGCKPGDDNTDGDEGVGDGGEQQDPNGILPLTAGFHFSWDGITGLSNFELEKMDLLPFSGRLNASHCFSPNLNFSGVWNVTFVPSKDAPESLGLTDFNIGFYAKGCGLDYYQNVLGDIITVNPYIVGQVALAGQVHDCGLSLTTMDRVDFVGGKLHFGWDSLNVDLLNVSFIGDIMASVLVTKIVERFGQEFITQIEPQLRSKFKDSLLLTNNQQQNKEATQNNYNDVNFAPPFYQIIPIQAKVIMKQTKENIQNFFTNRFHS